MNDPPNLSPTISVNRIDRLKYKIDEYESSLYLFIDILQIGLQFLHILI